MCVVYWSILFISSFGQRAAFQQETTYVVVVPPNSPLQQSRPVFGRAAEPPLAEQYSLGVRLVAVHFLRGSSVAATILPLCASPRGHRPRS
jgi:hypothetical protein